MALLARQDPALDQILYYEDVPLFEDELHDNGESILNARIVSWLVRNRKESKADMSQRVMPHCFFILARLFVRVDNVLFRVYDVRVYHAFESGEVLRETSGMEADYEEVKSVSCNKIATQLQLTIAVETRQAFVRPITAHESELCASSYDIDTYRRATKTITARDWQAVARTWEEDGRPETSSARCRWRQPSNEWTGHMSNRIIRQEPIAELESRQSRYYSILQL